MNKSIRAAVVLLTLLLLPMSVEAEHSASADTNGLNYYFATANDTVIFGDVMPIDWVVTNASGDSMVVCGPCGSPSGDFGYLIWAPGPPADPEPRVICGCCGCSPVIECDWFAPGEMYSRHFDRSTLSFPRPGTYTLEGVYSAYRMIEGGDLESIGYTFYLDFELWGGPTGAAEFEGTWSTIKALYR